MSYELLEQSKREFKKDSRRVAIKVKALYFRWAFFLISFFAIFSQKFIFEFQNFPERTKKEEIDALLSSYHIETTHTDKNNESCKVTQGPGCPGPSSDREGRFADAGSIFRQFSRWFPVFSIISSDKKWRKSIWNGNYFRLYLQMRLKPPDASTKLVWKAQERFFATKWPYFKDWMGKMRGLKPIIARGWHLEAKYTASDFMICVSHFPLEWNEKEFKDLIKDFGETEKCFLVRKSFKFSKKKLFFSFQKHPEILGQNTNCRKLAADLRSIHFSLF